MTYWYCKYFATFSMTTSYTFFPLTTSFYRISIEKKMQTQIPSMSVTEANMAFLTCQRFELCTKLLVIGPPFSYTLLDQFVKQRWQITFEIPLPFIHLRKATKPKTALKIYLNIFQTVPSHLTHCEWPWLLLHTAFCKRYTNFFCDFRILSSLMLNQKITLT